MGLQASGGGSGGGSGASQQSNCQCDCSRDWSNYWNDYMNFVTQYAVNLGPYAAAMAGGVMPKSWAPATVFRGPLPGSSNPLTSVPRGLDVPGMGGAVPRMGSAAIGLSGYAQGARGIAEGLGTTLEQTPIGGAMDYLANTAGVNLPNWLWKAASATFAANADGTATAAILSTNPASVWATIESPILAWRAIPIVFH